MPAVLAAAGMVSMAGGPKRAYFRWTPAADALLASALPAAAVAAKLGISAKAVHMRRCRLGIRAAPPSRWTPDRLQVLRDHGTTAAAARLGLSPATVSHARRRYGIRAAVRRGRPPVPAGPTARTVRLARRARALRAEGLTQAAIGRRLKLSRERVRELLLVAAG